MQREATKEAEIPCPGERPGNYRREIPAWGHEAMQRVSRLCKGSGKAEGFSFRHSPTGNWVCYHCFQLPGLWHFLRYLQSINAHTYFCSSFPIQLSHGTSLARLCQQSCPLQTWTSLSLLCVLEVLLSRFLCENIS